MCLTEVLQPRVVSREAALFVYKELPRRCNVRERDPRKVAMSEPCLCCGRPSTDESHFPVHRGMGGRPRKDNLPTVRLCRGCHTMQHTGDGAIIAAITQRAPAYWQSIGKWKDYREIFERWVDLYEYKGAIAACNG
jgi:hypothetical protein